MTVANIFGRDFYYGTAAEAATTTPRTDGALYWATDTLTLYCYSGAAWNVVGGGGAILINHDHSGDAGDGGTFDAANLTAGASTDGQVLTSDGAGGAAWEDLPAGGDVATDAIWDAKGDLAVGTGANTASKLSVGADGTVLTADSGQATGTAWANAAPVRQTILTFVGTLTISDNPLRIYNQMGVTQTISEVFIAVNTAPTGANIIADVHKDGVTIFTNQAHRPEIAAAGYTDSTTDIDVATWSDGEYLTAHVDQIGSTIAGADLVIHIIHR